MKQQLLTLIALLIMGTTGMATGKNLQIDVQASSVKWFADKAIGSGHNGTVLLKEGQVLIDDGVITGGTFTIDMQSIQNDDLSGDMKATLEKHLKSDDFFSVEAYPVSTFVLTKIVPVVGHQYYVFGNLTIKNKTNAITFSGVVSDNADGSKTIKAQRFSIDRTLWDVIYGSGSFFKGLADKAINNDVYFEVSITVPAE